MKFNRYQRPLAGAIFLAIVLFLFRLPISHLLNTTLVNPLFAEFKSGVWTDVILAFSLIVVAFWAAKEQPITILFRMVLYGGIFYGFQRANKYWSFVHLDMLPRLAYWDMVAVFMVVILPINYLLRKIKSGKSEVEPNQGFIEDNAVATLDEDHFRRRMTAKEIASLIKLTVNQRSFAIGILGEYGSGKTSFLNLINIELGRKEVLKIAFDPWSANNPETIRREFFDLLAREVADVDFKVSSLIYSYGRKLASFNTQSLSILNWLGVFKNSGSVQSSGEYQQINKLLRTTGRKIVVSIDDLDRLHPIEIMEVLKLIRNTANFSNVFYLVGYDKEYVQTAIKTLSEKGSIDYLDKIFQLEVPLPKREKNDILYSLQEHLRKVVSAEHFDVFENIMIPNGFRSRYEKAYSGILRQGRDVVRFINGFKIIYKLIGDEVDFECLVLLELIKFRFPAIYELIYINHDLFLYEQPLRASHQQYYSPIMVKGEKTETGFNEVSLFKIHIEKIDWLSAEDASLLNGLFMRLFKGNQYHRPEAKNSISYPLYFEIFFRYRLAQQDLSDKEFRAALTSGHMREYMEYCATHDLHKELMIRLMQEDINKDKRHFEQVIRWIFSFGRTYVEKEGMFRFDYGGLVDKIYDYHNQITEKLYKGDIGDYKDFINQLFKNALAPFLFENELIYHLKKKGEDFVLSPNDLTEHQYYYFTCMAESGHGLSNDTLWLYWGAREHYKMPADEREGYYKKWRFEPTLSVKMKMYLKDKDSKEFLRFSIQQDMRDRTKAFIHQQVMEMFSEPEEYRKLIGENALLDEDIQREYLEFFDKLAEMDFKQYVEMEFKTELNKPERI